MPRSGFVQGIFGERAVLMFERTRAPEKPKSSSGQVFEIKTAQLDFAQGSFAQRPG